MSWKDWANNVTPGSTIVYHPGDGTTEERQVWKVSREGDNPPRFALDSGIEISYLQCTPLPLMRQIELEHS